MARGGEGTIYVLADRPDQAAKIYHQPPPPEQTEKLKFMKGLGGREPELTALGAWPLDILISRDQKPVGFTMPFFKGGQAVHELFNPQSARKKFPPAGWSFLLATAANLARAAAVLHRCGLVIGDVNHSGFLVNQDATVKLIDCDSFQVADGTRRYLCRVGVPEYTPPELQGRDLSKVERGENHDAFGLAVLIFQLLFLGRHPFSGRYVGHKEAPSLDRAMAAYIFPYSRRRKPSEAEPPDLSLGLADITPELAELFERAFEPPSEGPRPTAAEWAAALEAMAGQLEQCPKNSKHQFLKDRPCPLCRVKAFQKPPRFPRRKAVAAAPPVHGSWNRPVSSGNWPYITPVSYGGRAPARKLYHISPKGILLLALATMLVAFSFIFADSGKKASQGVRATASVERTYADLDPRYPHWDVQEHMLQAMAESFFAIAAMMHEAKAERRQDMKAGRLPLIWAGGDSSLVQGRDGRVWLLGPDVIGHPMVKVAEGPESSPRLVTFYDPDSKLGFSFLERVVRIVRSGGDWLALTQNGRVLTWRNVDCGSADDVRGCRDAALKGYRLLSPFSLASVADIAASSEVILLLSEEDSLFLWARDGGCGFAGKPGDNLFSVAAMKMERGGSKHLTAMLRDKGGSRCQTVFRREPSLSWILLSPSMAGISLIEQAAGRGHGLKLDLFGELLAIGDDYYGQLGDGEFAEAYYPSKSYDQMEVSPLAMNQLRQAYPLKGLRVQAVAAGDEHSLAVDKNGDIWVWGRNHKGQLGLGDTQNRNRPVKLELPGAAPPSDEPAPSVI